jgi:hypothetical protein
MQHHTPDIARRRAVRQQSARVILFFIAWCSMIVAGAHVAPVGAKGEDLEAAQIKETCRSFLQAYLDGDATAMRRSVFVESRDTATGQVENDVEAVDLVIRDAVASRALQAAVQSRFSVDDVKQSRFDLFRSDDRVREILKQLDRAQVSQDGEGVATVKSTEPRWSFVVKKTETGWKVANPGFSDQQNRARDTEKLRARAEINEALAAEVNFGSYTTAVDVATALARRWHPAEAAINDKYDHRPIGTDQDVADIKLSCRRLFTAIMKEDGQEVEGCVRWAPDSKPELRRAMIVELFARHSAGSAAVAAFGQQALQLRGLYFDTELKAEMDNFSDGFMQWTNADGGSLMSPDRRSERDYVRTPQGWKTEYFRPESNTDAGIASITRRTEKLKQFEQRIKSGMYTTVAEANDALTLVLRIESRGDAQVAPPQK